jgi:hypothetical protein
MVRRQFRYLCSVLVALTMLLYAQAVAEERLLQDSLVPDSLGLPVPSNGTRQMMPDLAPDSHIWKNVNKQVPTYAPTQHPAVAPYGRFPFSSDGSARSISAMRVADDKVGIYNGSSHDLAFELGNPPNRIKLKPGQIDLFPLKAGANVVARIQAGNGAPTQSTLSAGYLYVLEAKNRSWVFNLF